MLNHSEDANLFFSFPLARAFRKHPAGVFVDDLEAFLAGHFSDCVWHNFSM